MSEEQKLSYHERLRLIKLGKLPKEAVAKKKKPLRQVSPQRAKEIAEQKSKGSDGEMDAFFVAMRKKMVGTCQCGCAKKSSKFEDDHYRCSISHIFPKRIFKSIATNPLNWVERNFWDGCHSKFDDRSIKKWINMADWEDIKAKFHELTPLLTGEERSKKFYSQLEKLVYEK